MGVCRRRRSTRAGLRLTRSWFGKREDGRRISSLGSHTYINVACQGNQKQLSSHPRRLKTLPRQERETISSTSNPIQHHTDYYHSRASILMSIIYPRAISMSDFFDTETRACCVHLLSPTRMPCLPLLSSTLFLCDVYNIMRCTMYTLYAFNRLTMSVSGERGKIAFASSYK